MAASVMPYRQAVAAERQRVGTAARSQTPTSYRRVPLHSMALGELFVKGADADSFDAAKLLDAAPARRGLAEAVRKSGPGRARRGVPHSGAGRSAPGGAA